MIRQARRAFSAKAPGKIPLVVLLATGIAVALALFAWVIPGGRPPEVPSVESAAPQQADAPRAWQTIGSQGDGPGQFQQPRGITGLADGSFVVVDRSARVRHFSASGQPLSVWSMAEHQMGNPKGLCVLPDGSLLVCDTHYGRVLKMSVEGKLLQTWGGPGLGHAEFSHPLSAAVDAVRGVAYVCEYGAYNDRIQKFKLDGTFVKAWGRPGDQPGEFSRPSGLALDAAGNLYVADACNHRIQKFDSDGNLLKVFGKIGFGAGELRYPYDVACGPNGLLYVAEFNNHRVSVWDTDGNFVRNIGGPGGGDWQFANPWSLTVDARGRLLVSDTGNHRVQVIDPAVR
jgi:DNA-binding beta-propeller fold protein YncE